MKTNISVSLFSPGQVAGIVILSILVAALIGLCGYLVYLLHKRGVHVLHTEQLQLQRNELMRKLDAMRAGVALGDLPQTANVAEEEDDEEEEEAVAADEDADDDGDIGSTVFDDEVETEGEVEVTESGTVVRYNRSFTARITQADNDLKARYSELKNYLLGYRGVKARMSWRRETFHIGRKSAVAFVVRGKTLCIFLATDPTMFEGTKYKVEDMSGRSNKNPMPCMYKITSDRKMSYAKELVDIVMAGYNAAKNPEYKPDDFTLPYKSTEVLIKRRLIKVSGGVADLAREDAMAAAKGIHYNRSFAARIIQSDDALKSCYSRVKNHLMAHKDVVAVDTWKRETFRKGRTVVAAFIIRGKTLCLCLATDPAKYDGTKYKVEDLTVRNKNTNTPLLYRVKGDRRVTYAMQLIDQAFAEQGIEAAEIETVNYAVPFVATETLVRRGLIKVTEGTTPRFRDRILTTKEPVTDTSQETNIESTQEAKADTTVQETDTAPAQVEVPERLTAEPTPETPTQEAAATEDKAE